MQKWHESSEIMCVPMVRRLRAPQLMTCGVFTFIRWSDVNLIKRRNGTCPLPYLSVCLFL